MWTVWMWTRDEPARARGRGRPGRPGRPGVGRRPPAAGRRPPAAGRRPPGTPAGRQLAAGRWLPGAGAAGRARRAAPGASWRRESARGTGPAGAGWGRHSGRAPTVAAGRPAGGRAPARRRRPPAARATMRTGLGVAWGAPLEVRRAGAVRDDGDTGDDAAAVGGAAA